VLSSAVLIKSSRWAIDMTPEYSLRKFAYLAVVLGSMLLKSLAPARADDIAVGVADVTRLDGSAGK
jgi:hypothetical protein